MVWQARISYKSSGLFDEVRKRLVVVVQIVGFLIRIQVDGVLSEEIQFHCDFTKLTFGVKSRVELGMSGYNLDDGQQVKTNLDSSEFFVNWRQIS